MKKKGLFSNPVRALVAFFCILLPIIALWITYTRSRPADDTPVHADAHSPAPPPLSDPDSPTPTPKRTTESPTRSGGWISLQDADIQPDAAPEAVLASLSAWGLQTLVKDGDIHIQATEAPLVLLALQLGGLVPMPEGWTLDDVTASPVDDPRLHQMQTWLAGRDTLARMLPVALGLEGVGIAVKPSSDPYAGCIVRLQIPYEGFEGLSSDDRARIRQHVQSLLAPVTEFTAERLPHTGELPDTPPPPME